MRRYPYFVAALVLSTSTALFVGCATVQESEYPTVEKLTPGIFLEPPRVLALPPGIKIRPVPEEGIELTKSQEGFRGHPYNDAAGYCTVAYGHLIFKLRCDDHSVPAEFRDGVSREEGTVLLRKDMSTAQYTVMDTTEGVELTDGQYAALVDFVYNVGSTNFRKSGLLRCVKVENYPRIKQEFPRWVKAGGKVLPGLVKRREAEMALFFEGIEMPSELLKEEAPLPPIDIRVGEVETVLQKGFGEAKPEGSC